MLNPPWIYLQPRFLSILTSSQRSEQSRFHLTRSSLCRPGYLRSCCSQRFGSQRRQDFHGL